MRFTVTAAAYHVLLLQTSHKKGLRLHTWLLKMKTLLVISASLCIRLLLHSLISHPKNSVCCCADKQMLETLSWILVIGSKYL